MKNSKLERLEARARKLMATVEGTDKSHTEKANSFLHKFWGGSCRPWLVMPLRGETRGLGGEKSPD